MNLKPLTDMFMDDQGGLDEIVVVIAVFIAYGLGFDFYTHAISVRPELVGTAMVYTHPQFHLDAFGDGMMKMAAGAGAWQALRGGMRAFTARRQQPANAPQ